MTTGSSPSASVWIGIDVSKQTLDVCLLRGTGKSQHKSFGNDMAGYAQLLNWVQPLAEQVLCHFCLESTGTYSQALAQFLVEAEQRVSVVNPARIKYAGLSQGVGNKTDKADAKVIADYCRKENPPLWRLASPEVQTLIALTRRVQSVQELLHQEKNRLAQPGLLPIVQQSLAETIGFLEDQINRLKEQIEQHINTTPSLKADMELLRSIPGIGEGTAQKILAELPDVSSFASAQSAAAYAGLCPQEHRSGRSIHKPTRLSKRGNVALRKALYLPAMAALRYNPLVKAHYERLVQAGKPKMVALGAAMRKLLMIAVGVLKSRTEFTTEPMKKATTAA